MVDDRLMFDRPEQNENVEMKRVEAKQKKTNERVERRMDLDLTFCQSERHISLDLRSLILEVFLEFPVDHNYSSLRMKSYAM